MPLITLRLNIFNIYELSFYMVGVIILSFWCLLNFNRTSNRRLLSFHVAELILFTFVIYIAFSIFYTSNTRYGIVMVLKLTILFVLYLLSKIVFQNLKNISIVMRYSIISCSIYLLFLAYHYLIRLNKLYIGIDTLNGSIQGRNSLALAVLIIASFSIGFMLNMRGKELWKFFPFAIIVLFGVLLLQSRGIMVALSIVVFYIVFKERKNKSMKPFFIILIIIFFLFNYLLADDIKDQILERIESVVLVFSDDIENSEGVKSINSRKILIKNSLESISKHPLLGIGVGSFVKINNRNYASPHNDYLYIATEMGLIGFLLYCLLNIYFIKMAYYNFQVSRSTVTSGLLLAILSICIYSLFIKAYDNFLIWSVYAMISVVYDINKAKTS